QGLFGIRHPTDGVAELLEQAGTDGRDVRIVVDQQYRATAARCGGRRMLDRYDILARQQDRDPGPLAYVAGDLDRSAGLMRKAVDLGQPQAGTLADRLGGKKGVEYPAHQIRRDADAGILDRD